jgi:hypothetical protein
MEQLLPRESGRYLKTILGNVNVSILDTKGRRGNLEILGFRANFACQHSSLIKGCPIDLETTYGGGLDQIYFAFRNYF